MYRQFHRILEAFKITEKKEDIKEEFGKDAPKPSNKPLEKVTDQFAADEEAVEVRIFTKNFYNLKISFFNTRSSSNNVTAHGNTKSIASPLLTPNPNPRIFGHLTYHRNINLSNTTEIFKIF